jgi:large subunit ribosomal protein L32
VPVPKRRTTSSKRDMRRANYDKIAPPNLVPCSNCSAPSLPHRVCVACGHYRGRAVLRREPAVDAAGTGTTGGGTSGAGE